MVVALASFASGCGGDIEARMAEVRALQDVGQFSASIEELREILAISPDYPEAAYRLGVALVQTGESSRAVWALQKAAESPAYQVTAGILLASAHLNNQNFEETVRAADEVLKVDPERQLALQLRAKGNLGAGRLEAALEDTQRLVELFPDDYSVRVLYATVLSDNGRLDEAKVEYDLVKKLGAESGDPAIEPRSCLAPAIFVKNFGPEPLEAEPLYLECLALYPTDSFVITQCIEYFDGIEKPERSTEIVRAAVDQAPESLQLRSTLANRLNLAGDVEGAEKVLVDAAESFGSASAWNLLAGFYRRANEPGKALVAIEKVIELSGGGSDQLRFTHADVLVDLGELDRAEEVAGSLSEPTYATLIRGRILLGRGDPQGALAAFEKGIRNWPNNAGARYLAGLAARELGDYDRAISELREAVRSDVSATDAALLLAQIHLDRGQYRPAATFANEALKGPQGNRQVQAYVIAARAFTEMGRYDRARKSVETLVAVTGPGLTPTVELASIERRARGSEAALAVIRASGLDATEPENRELLRVLAETLVQAGRSDDALARVDAALGKSGDDAELYEIRGAVLVRANRSDAARTAFTKAREIDEKSAGAWAGLATLAANEGDAARAIELFDRAAELAPERYDYAYSSASFALASDDPSARERLEKVVRQAPGHAGARNDLAWLLAEKGEGADLDRALALAQEARDLDDSPAILDTLGWVHLKRGESEQAVAVFEEAVSAEPNDPSLRYHLAMALQENGQEERASEVLRPALDTGSFPEVEDARRLASQLERR